MQKPTIDRLNERMGELLEFYSPNIVKTYEHWKSKDFYLALGENWLDRYTNVINEIHKAAVALCTEESMSVIWIPNWIEAIRVKARNQGNDDDIKAIIKNWKDYYHQLDAPITYSDSELKQVEKDEDI
jgi:hypothetical protein